VNWLTRDVKESAEPVGWGRWLRPSGPAPLPIRLEWLFDLVLGFCVAVPLKPERANTRTVAPSENAWIDKGETALIVLCVLGPLVIRRRFPLASTFLMLAMLSIFPIPLVLVGLAALVAAYSAAVYSPYHRLALCALPFAVIELLSRRYLLLLPGDKLLMLFLIVPLLIGLAFYGSEIRRQASTDVAARKRTRKEMRKEAIRLAVEGERSRLAPERGHDQDVRSSPPRQTATARPSPGRSRRVRGRAGDARVSNDGEGSRSSEDSGRAVEVGSRDATGVLPMLGYFGCAGVTAW
jgi:hypothetical protein